MATIKRKPSKSKGLSSIGKAAKSAKRKATNAWLKGWGCR